MKKGTPEIGFSAGTRNKFRNLRRQVEDEKDGEESASCGLLY
jgi:hypothetical protein